MHGLLFWHIISHQTKSHEFFLITCNESLLKNQNKLCFSLFTSLYFLTLTEGRKPPFVLFLTQRKLFLFCCPVKLEMPTE